MYNPYIIFKIEKPTGTFKYNLVEPEEKLCSDFKTKEDAENRIKEYGKKHNHYVIKKVYKSE